MSNVAVSSDARPGFWSYFGTACITLWIGCFAAFFGVTLPQFTALFQGFGAELPAVTEFVLGQAVFLWLLMLTLFIVQFALCIYFLISKSYTARRAVLLSSGVNVTFQFILLGAIYVPIFRLGAVV